MDAMKSTGLNHDVKLIMMLIIETSSGAKGLIHTTHYITSTNQLINWLMTLLSMSVCVSVWL